MVDNKNIPIISIKKIERNISKTYTDTETNIKAIEKIAKQTYRSFNDVLREIVNNFIENGQIYDPENKEYYSVKEIIEIETEKDKDND